MKRLLVLLVLVFGSGYYFLGSPPIKEFSSLSEVKGDWSGVLEFKGMKTNMVLHVLEEKDGYYTALVDAPDQGVNGIQIDAMSFEGQVLKFEIDVLKARFEGEFKGGEIHGVFVQQGMEFPLVLVKGEFVAASKRPQEPKRPFPYIEEEVSYQNPTSGETLAGTLTLPEGEGPFPAVLLITGSGQHDRDETVFGHKPFLVIADYLTRQGIAVLRVDDRGFGQSTGEFAGATTKDFATDALASVAYLKTRNEIKKEQIGLIGHSEGGIIAPMCAAQCEDVAFVVMMAGPSVDGVSLLQAQSEAILKNEGISDEVIGQYQSMQDKLYTILKKEEDRDVAAGLLRDALGQSKEVLQVVSHVEDSESIIPSIVEQLNSDWYRFYISFDPSTYIRQVKVPLLALNGSLDQQVLVSQNLPQIASILEEEGHSDFTTVELPELNHFFQTCLTGNPTEYQLIEETISPLALETMSEWIHNHL